MLEKLEYETYEALPKSLSAYLYELWCFVGKGGRTKRLGQRLGLAKKH
jgi:hypothetical protein